MATLAQWVEGARLRTLPLAAAPVAVGTGAALGELGGLPHLVIGSFDVDTPPGGASMLEVFSRGLLALILALGLQIGTNYANDYSDGVRGTDDERVGPLRLTASGLAAPETVKRAAFLSFGVAALAGVALVLVSGAWLLLPVGATAVLAAWYYTGGKRPYGYRGLGEVFVFVYFGLVATAGTTYAQVGTVPLNAWIGAVGVGLFSCAVLMINNIRDIATDTLSGKRTLAVRLGQQRARYAYAAMVLVPYVLLIVPILTGTPAVFLAVLSLALMVGALQTVLSGEEGHALVPPLKQTGITTLVYGLLLALGLAL
ncbi:1,4-dihydroxy-2-naphthoate polyprenyltransferase [Sediminivirga luteola]|uniref:1,4-dihydroxy-2-naphthoate polyprenyltransferase n=1 Tax=Sediminivirga luteola TaxID=1774748 RepID=UPI001F57BE96|nr:1,4-dihydroxy-2-naphthoate polyprenyltransferase [Sediminivirga luteola]MCI2264722.1 1,4-dihydroxy-2-naphthoate polyprenyltransferase [Sediminivirga luteola]